MLCTLRFRKKAKDSIHTYLEVEELKAERDSLQPTWEPYPSCWEQLLKGRSRQDQRKDLADKPNQNDFGTTPESFFDI